jgi:hypothetical protein
MTYTNSAGELVHLTLLDIEQRLYDLSFDPNHPPELRWGAPLGSDERSSAPETHTPTPGGGRIAMEDAYARQAYYRVLGQRETDASYLSDMFTTGFPVRDKLDAQVGKWGPSAPVVIAGNSATPATIPAQEPAPAAVPETPPGPSIDTTPPTSARTTYRGLAHREPVAAPLIQTVSLTDRPQPARRERRDAVRPRIGRYR